MRRRELIERIDRHMERGNVLMERIDQHMERGDVLMERIDRHIDEAARGHADLRAFIREATVRFERSAALQERAIERLMERHEKPHEGQDDLRDQIRAQTAALWRLVDRLGPGPAQA